MAMKTKDRILEIARRNFNRYGFSAVTMRQIAEEAGISPGNLTYYYRYKRDIVNALMDQSFSETYQPEPINTLDEFLNQVRRMLETLQRDAFYFLDDKNGFESDDKESMIHKHLR